MEQVDPHVTISPTNEDKHAEEEKRKRLQESIEKAKKTVKNTIQQAGRLEALEQIRKGVKSIPNKPWKDKDGADNVAHPAPGSDMLKGKSWQQLNAMGRRRGLP